VDVAAPGVNLVSACPVPPIAPAPFCKGRQYGLGSGTSFSTPIVSGAAALLIAQDPQISGESLATRLKATALNMPDENHPNWDGEGRIDIGGALGAGSGFASIDISADEGTQLQLRVEIDGQGAAACTSHFWNGLVDRVEIVERTYSRAGIHGLFGTGECSEYWPPSADRPWYLAVSTGGPKAAILNAFSLRLGDQLCAGNTQPEVITPGPAKRIPVACEAPGLVANDTREGATIVDTQHLPVRLEQELRHATIAADDPVTSCTPPPTPATPAFSRSVWYRIEPNGQPGALAVDTFGSEIDVEIPTLKTVLAVFRSTQEGLSQVACNVLFRSPLADTQSRVVFRTDGQSTYFVIAAAFQAIPMGRLRITFTQAMPPSNDDAVSPETIAVSDQYPVVQPAHSATRNATDPTISCAGAYGYSVWLRVQEPGTQQLTLSTSGSDYDTVAAVFSKNPDGSLTEVACNNQVPGTFTASVTWPSSGEEYLVVVGAFGGSAGSVLQARLQAQ
jgi:hypothetical protein